ncbi:hypothetical protein EV126DRAFT_447546 [Verticillium dahliae]|nr:hypothetical protein EV126DRAFT_447546 [Verticillium dahliae]
MTSCQGPDTAPASTQQAHQNHKSHELLTCSIKAPLYSYAHLECWLRVPRQDLGAFAAALTAWPGTRDAGAHTILRIRQCSDWLGAMVGGDGQDKLWTS